MEKCLCWECGYLAASPERGEVATQTIAGQRPALWDDEMTALRAALGTTCRAVISSFCSRCSGETPEEAHSILRSFVKNISYDTSTLGY